VTQPNLPPTWVSKDICEVVPASAKADVVKYMKRVLDPKTRPESIGMEAANVLAKHDAAFRENGVDLRFFGYWIENAYNQRTLAAFLEALQKGPQKEKTIGDILPPEALEKLQDFVNAYRSGRLIVEPGKMNVTMLRERVLEPYRDKIIGAKTGIHDLDYLAIVLCQMFGICDPD